MAPKILILTGDAAETLEVFYRYQQADPALEPDVTVAGATFRDGEAVVDGQLVSGRAWPDHPGWMRAFMRVLRERAPVEREAAGATA